MDCKKFSDQNQAWQDLHNHGSREKFCSTRAQHDCVEENDCELKTEIKSRKRKNGKKEARGREKARATEPKPEREANVRRKIVYLSICLMVEIV